MGEDSRSRGLDVTPVLFIDLVHLCKVPHIGEEDVDLDDILQRRAGGLKNCFKIGNALVLEVDISIGVLKMGDIATDSVVLDCSLHNLAAQIFGKLAGTEDEAIGDDGLVVDWSRPRRLVGLDSNSRHIG